MRKMPKGTFIHVHYYHHHHGTRYFHRVFISKQLEGLDFFFKKTASIFEAFFSPLSCVQRKEEMVRLVVFCSIHQGLCA